jgi:hypothetical protein
MKLENLVKALGFIVPLAVAYNVKPVGAQQAQPQQQTQQTQQAQQRQCPSYVKEFWKSKEDYKNSIKRDVSGDVVVYTIISNDAQLKLGMAIGDIVGGDLRDPGSIVVIGYKAGGNEIIMRVEKEGQIITKKVKGAANVLRIYALLNPDVYNCFVEPKAEEAKAQIAKPQPEAKEEILPEKFEEKKQTLEQKIIKELEGEEKGKKGKTLKVRKKEVEVEEKGMVGETEETARKLALGFDKSSIDAFIDYESKGTVYTTIGANKSDKYTILGGVETGKNIENYNGEGFNIIGNVGLGKGFELLGSFFGNDVEKKEFSKKTTEFSLGLRKQASNFYIGSIFSYSEVNGRDDFQSKEVGAIEGIGSYETSIFGHSKTKDREYSLLLDLGHSSDRLKIGGLLGYLRIEGKSSANGVYTVTFYDLDGNKIDSESGEIAQKSWTIDNVFSPGVRVEYSKENFGVESIILGNIDTKGWVDGRQRVNGSLLAYGDIPIKKPIVIQNGKKEGAMPIVFNAQAYGGKLNASLGINRNPNYYRLLDNSRIYLPPNAFRFFKEFSDSSLYKLNGTDGFGGEVSLEVGEGIKPIYEIRGSYCKEGVGCAEVGYEIDRNGADSTGLRFIKGLGKNFSIYGGTEIKNNGKFGIGVGIEYRF